MNIPLTPLRCLGRAANLFGRKTGVVCGGKRFTYNDMADRCARLASALTRNGVEPGDRVGYLSYNTHQLLEGYYGPLQARAIAMPLNVRLTAVERPPGSNVATPGTGLKCSGERADAEVNRSRRRENTAP